MFLRKLQTRQDTAGIQVLEKYSPHQGVLIFPCPLIHGTYLVALQVYKSIFMSPSSAKDVSEEEDNTENMPPAKSQKTSSGNNPVHRNVASKLHLNNKVTPHSITYAAVQVCLFLLCYLLLICSSSSISTSKLPVRGLQLMVDLTTKDYITILSMSLRMCPGLLRRNVPKIYSIGGRSQYFLSLNEYSIKQ